MALSVSSAGPFGALNGYWGQDGSERLADYCDSGIQYVTLSFVNEAPENSPSGYPGTNFAGHCWAGTYNNTEGVPSNLLSNCVGMKEDIGYCQSRGVKVLLSIGGEYDAGTSNYEVTTEDNGRAFADFLYGAFGPYDPDWDGPRPFDSDDDGAGGQQQHTEVDGWDFDIEKAFPNAPYMAMIERFRELDPTKLITAAPQCPTDLLNFHLRDLVLGSAIDLLFVQFYNNPGCDAIPGLLPWDRFNYDAWADLLDAGDANPDTKLFIGLPASAGAAGSGYVGPETVKDLVCRYKDKPRFGGVSLWDLSRGRANVVGGKDFNEHVLDALRYGCDPVPEPVPTTTASVSTTASTTALSSSTSLPGSPSTTPVSSSSTITSETPSVSSSASSPSPSSSSLSSSSIYSTPVQSPPSSTPSVASSSTQSTSTSDAVTSSSSVSSTHPPFPTLSIPHNWNATTTTSHGASTTSHSQTTSPSDLTTVSQSQTTTSSDGATITEPPPTTTSGTVSFTTSTSFTTVTKTITDCPPYVVDCPEDGYVTTVVVPVYTTVCPITDVPEPTQAGVPDVPGDDWTTSTMYITKTKIITDCGPHVECPEGGVTTTEVIISTTVCPVEPTHDTPAPPGDDGEHGDEHNDDDGSEHGGDDTGNSPGHDNEEVPGKPSVTTATTVATVQPTKPGDGGWVSVTRTNVPTGAVPTVPGAPQPTIPVEAGASGLAVGVSGIIAAFALQLWL
ncbi:hypothetical protein N3K66_000189 [Trichothecium roseum]|uniref:Uncharacterized protein n=1 Tax=Trichothecium roseum TaxID=47278 RepID=A0ACC0VCV1_9HYPO|nr:hypothetical protein N3K66_000189 [Trichothecium roseum]